MTNRTAEKTEACAAALRRHRFEAEVVKDAEAAFALMKVVVEAENPQLVSFGDSMTMRGTGIVEWLRSNGRLTLGDVYKRQPRSPTRSGWKSAAARCCRTFSSRA